MYTKRITTGYLKNKFLTYQKYNNFLPTTMVGNTLVYFLVGKLIKRSIIIATLITIPQYLYFYLNLNFFVSLITWAANQLPKLLFASFSRFNKLVDELLWKQKCCQIVLWATYWEWENLDFKEILERNPSDRKLQLESCNIGNYQVIKVAIYYCRAFISKRLWVRILILDKE